MGSVYKEISRLETAKQDIETAIEYCGVNVPDSELIDTYANYIRQIPSAVFSQLNADLVGGTDKFISSIKQTNGIIEATAGGLVSASYSGLVPKIGTTAADTIKTPADEWVLTSTKGAQPTWRKLPANAFKNDDNNTTYTLSGTLNGNAYDVTLTPSSGSATGAKVPAMGAASNSAAGTAGLVPAPAKNQHNSFLRGDGTWVVPDNTTYSVMTGATASAAGKSGLVPQPAKGDQSKFLSGAGTWTALPSLSVTDSESGNAVTDVEVSGHGITLKRGTTFSVNGHKHSSDDITSLPSYVKATTASAITTTDSLNTALGKLELKADTAYNLVKGAYDGDGTIENLTEILRVLEGISDTDTIQAIVGKYLPLTGGMMTGNITFDSNRMIRWHQSDTYSISCPTGSDGAYLLLKAHNGITIRKRLSIYTNAESLPNTNYNLYTDGSLYAASATFGATTITGGADLTLQAGSKAQGDAGDIVFKDYSGAELGRIWLDSTTSQALSLRYGANDAIKRILHSGNAYISNGVITINGVSITPLTSHQSLTNYVTLNTVQTITGLKTFTNNDESLCVNRTGTYAAEPCISYFKNGTRLGSLGIKESVGPFYWDTTKAYNILHSGNTYISDRTITINGVSITPLTSHQSLANYVTLNGAQTISGVKTFSSQQKFTVAQGTSPFTVTSTTQVANLNAQYVNGYSETSFFRSLRGDVDTNYIDLTTYTSGQASYKNYDSGTYTVPRSGHSDTYICFRSSGSTSAIELLCSYADTSRLKLRKTIDANRVSGGWRDLAFLSDVPTKVSQLTNDSGYMLKSEALTLNLTTITKTLTVTKDWMDTGIKYTDLPTGTYAVQVYSHTTDNLIWYGYWSGIMTWYGDATNSSEADEILLHRGAHAYNGNTIYLRTINTASSDGRHMRLQIAANKNFSSATYTFKFKKLI